MSTDEMTWMYKCFCLCLLQLCKLNWHKIDTNCVGVFEITFIRM
ncbi:hypothetical protein GLYMA_04G052950v4 [Glycine max]|nr:hypothetical protein GLYMA_04G052950v4 [Glycine max]KAH1109895.1 hypothetical protein GYH30_009008 [Glycine max]